MAETTPSRGEQQEPQEMDILVALATKKARRLVEADEETVHLTYAETQVPSDNNEEQAQRAVVFDELNTLYDFALSARFPDLLEIDDPMDKMLYITQNVGEIKNIDGRHSQVDYEANNGKAYRITHMYMDIDGIGHTEGLYVCDDDPERTVAYQVIINVDGKIWHSIERGIIDLGEGLSEHMLDKLPPTLMPHILDVLRAIVPENLLPRWLDEIKAAAENVMDGDDVDTLMAGLSRHYQRHRAIMREEEQHGLNDLDPVHVQEMHAIIDNRARQIAL